MAHLAWDAIVRAVEFERGMAAVVEFGRPPGQGSVAPRARILALTGYELAGVHVRVATGAILRSAPEGYGPHSLFQSWLVTRQAIYRGMPAH